MARLKLEGKLAHEWVQEAETAWVALSAKKDNRDLVVDLLDVSFVDDAGHQLLAAMRHSGAELIGGGILVSALIEEIEEAETSGHGNSEIAIGTKAKQNSEE